MSDKRGAAKVLIVGAGICGLAAACFLKQSGYSVIVVERVPTWAPLTPGLMLHANALRVLGSLGLGDELERRGVVLRGARLLDASGRQLSEISFADEIKRGQKTLGVGHEALLDALRARLGEGAVRMGITVSSFNLSDPHVDAYFSDGTHERFELLVGADGARSRVRELLMGPLATRQSGSVYWRAIVPRPTSLAPDQTGEVLGAGLRVGWVPLGDDRVYAFFQANLAPHDTQIRGLDAEGITAHFAALGGPVGELLAGLAGQTPLASEVEDLWLDTWHKGRVVLVGDAAHAMTPTLAQGAAMALEDAKALQFCLDQACSIDDALVSFEAMRQGRVRAILEASFDAGRVNQWSSGAAVSFRNLLYRVLPAGVARSRLRTLIDGSEQVREFLSHRPDLPPPSEASLRLVRYLVKMGQMDGRFDDEERAFIQASLQEQGEYVSLALLEELSIELHRVPLRDVLAPFEHESEPTRERLLELGYLAALANGHVAPPERKALEEVAATLRLGREALTRLGRAPRPIAG